MNGPVVVGGFVVGRGVDVVNCKGDDVEGNSEDDARNDAVAFDEEALVVSDGVC